MLFDPFEYVLSVIINRFFAGSCDDDREELWLDELDSEEEYEFEGEAPPGAPGMPADDRLELDAAHAANSSGRSLATVLIHSATGGPPQEATNGSGYDRPVARLARIASPGSGPTGGPPTQATNGSGYDRPVARLARIASPGSGPLGEEK